MGIEFLEESIKLPWDRQAFMSGDPDKQADVIENLVLELERNRLYEVRQTINLMLELNSGAFIYMSLPDANGAYGDGSWRLGVVDGGLEIQKKISGTWTKIARND